MNICINVESVQQTCTVGGVTVAAAPAVLVTEAHSPAPLR